MSLDDALDRLDEWLERRGGKYARFLPPKAEGSDGSRIAPSFVRIGDEIPHIAGGKCYVLTRDGRPGAFVRVRNCPLAEWECGGRRDHCLLRCGGLFSAHTWRFAHGGREAGTN